MIIVKKKAKLCFLITIKYEDEISIKYALKYLKKFYNYKSKIINVDYSKILSNAINKKNQIHLIKIVKLLDAFSISVKL